MPENKPRLPRVDRLEDTHIEDETAHLWAVSYADFLMVLLSFFILFFSVEDKTKEDVIQQILATNYEGKAQGLGPGQGVGKGPGDGSGKSQAEFKSAAPRNIAAVHTDALKEILERFDVKVDKTDKRIIFMFPDNMYKTGELELNQSLQKQLSEILNRLKPYARDIDVTFVGHTDQVPLGPSRGPVLNDNFALSVVRATRALQYAIRAGFPPERMAAKGSAEKKRNTRSLSIVIRPRNDEI